MNPNQYRQEFICGDVAFIGSHLGGATTGDADKARWTDVDIYRTKSGTFIAHVVGRSIVGGETDLHTVHRTTDPDELIQKMHHKGRLPLPACQALNNAADEDDDIDAALERFEEPTFIE